MAQDRIEIIGGAFYEPILSMIPRRDRIGQIRSVQPLARARLRCKVRGMWIPERVWEPTMVSDLADADIQYTVLDDFHFRNAGLSPDLLDGYFISENDGQILAIFPGSERLRYTIPFAAPEATIDHLRSIAERRPEAVVVFGDDGEKFGTWPETKKHVYDDGWLSRFFDALVANESWIKTTTLAEAVDNVPPNGKIYLPDSSYREMTEWALPTSQLLEYERVRHDMEHDPRWPVLSQFVRGGFWRNFKVKYPEADEMYTRMLMISRRVEEAEQKRHDRRPGRRGPQRAVSRPVQLQLLARRVRRHLFAPFAQCRLSLADRGRQSARPCSRSATSRGSRPWSAISISTPDKKFFWPTTSWPTLIRPWRGGLMYELDVRSICHNLLATLARQPEAYHRKVLAGPNGKPTASAAFTIGSSSSSQG